MVVLQPDGRQQRMCQQVASTITGLFRKRKTGVHGVYELGQVIVGQTDSVGVEGRNREAVELVCHRIEILWPDGRSVIVGYSTEYSQPRVWVGSQ